ncbi:phosducin-like protein, putative [Plasmodium vivax]|uniref:Phosducin-like protein, putative n=1 Tax=Plasmodium vivax TaxID=5855 RepID=A0A1G4GYU2_PLAVI|nr:phosducin-like protein, putative [Plasmodium vivax]
MSTTNPTGETTEWDDLQRKYGNLPPLEKEVKEEEIYLSNLEKLQKINPLERKNLHELTLLEESCVDEEYLKIIERYKANRMNEINRSRLLDVFGEVYEISKDNFLCEVNEASRRKNPLGKQGGRSVESTRGDEDLEDEEEAAASAFASASAGAPVEDADGTHVVVHLYSDNVLACKVLNNVLSQMAKKHKYVKFTKGVYNRIVENFPEFKLPTLLIYYNGACIHQICDLMSSIRGGVKNLTLKTFEQLMAKYNILRYPPSWMHSGQSLSDHTIDGSEEESEDGGRYAERGSDGLRDGTSRTDRYAEKGSRVRTHKQYTSFNMFRRKNTNGDYSSDEGGWKSRGYASSMLDRKVSQSEL